MSWTRPFRLFISSSVPVRDFRYLHFLHLTSLCLLIWYFYVLDLLIYSPSSSSISWMTISTRLFLASSYRMKVMSSVCFGSTLTVLVSLSVSKSRADQSGCRWSYNWVLVGRGLLAYTI